MPKTKLISQSGGECALTTLAMLAGKPIELIRRRACGKVGVQHWDEVAYDTDRTRFWTAIQYVSTFYGLENEMMIGNSPRPGMAMTRSYLIMREKLPTIHGRGQLVFETVSDAHSVVFDDGLVYDSNLSEPRTLGEYLLHVMFSYYNPGKTEVKIWTKLAVEWESVEKA